MSLIDIDIKRAAKQTMLDVQQQVLIQPWRKSCGDINTNGEKYIDLEDISGWDGVREFKGERHYDDLVKLSHTVDTTKWEKSVEFDDDDMKTSGFKTLVQTRLQQLGLMFVQHPNKLYFELLKNRTSTKTIDGVTFFNAAHPVPGSESITNSNIVSGGGTTVANIYEDFIKVELAFGAMKTRSDDYIWRSTDALKYRLLYGPNLHSQMRTLFSPDEPTTSDPYRGKLIGRAMPEKHHDLDDNDWYVEISNAPIIKPFAYVKKYNPVFGWKNANKKPDFETDKVRYGGKAAYKIHYWHYAGMVLVNN